MTGVILTNCDAFENFLSPRFRYLNWGARVPGLFWVMGQLLRVPALRRVPFAYGRLTRGSLPDDLLARYVRPLQCSAGIRRDLTKVLQGISSRHTVDAAQWDMSGRPALVGWDPEDPIFPLAHGQRLAQLLGAPLLEVPGTYALIPEDQPLRLATAIHSFMEEVLCTNKDQRQLTA